MTNFVTTQTVTLIKRKRKVSDFFPIVLPVDLKTTLDIVMRFLGFPFYGYTIVPINEFTYVLQRRGSMSPKARVMCEVPDLPRGLKR